MKELLKGDQTNYLEFIKTKGLKYLDANSLLALFLEDN